MLGMGSGLGYCVWRLSVWPMETSLSFRKQLILSLEMGVGWGSSVTVEPTQRFGETREAVRDSWTPRFRERMPRMCKKGPGRRNDGPG